MFFILGSLGCVWAAIWFWLFRDYPESSRFVSRSELAHIREGHLRANHHNDQEMRNEELASGRTTWRFMLLNPALVANNYAFFAFGYVLFFALTWLPGYLQSTYSLNLKEIGIFLIAPWLTAALLILLAGAISDRLWVKTGSVRASRSHLIWICQLASALSFLPVLFHPSLPLALASISLGVGFALMPKAAFCARNVDLARDRAATSLGIMDCFFAAAGILAPAITGHLAQASGNFNAAFGLLIAFTLTSVAGILIFQHPDRQLYHETM